MAFPTYHFFSKTLQILNSIKSFIATVLSCCFVDSKTAYVQLPLIINNMLWLSPLMDLTTEAALIVDSVQTLLEGLVLEKASRLVAPFLIFVNP